MLGFGIAITTTASPAYVVEMSPPQVNPLKVHGIFELNINLMVDASGEAD